MGYARLVAGDIEVVIGDNSAAGEHRAGYNGVWSVQHGACPRSPFVPAYAGLNHEHIFDGSKNHDRAVFFEPRVAAMTLQQVSDRAVELHQPPTPTFHLESWTRFTVRPPHYIDMHYRCVPRQHAFEYGYIGLFWASYIDGPEDKSIYFLGQRRRSEPVHWLQLCTQAHNDQSTAVFVEEQAELQFADAYPNALFRNYSRLRFARPFFYGHFENLVLIFMFDRSRGIRFTHSPSGGGFNRERRTTNPAWDFQFIIPRYEVNRAYGFRMRLAVRSRCSREAIEAEYEKWRGELDRLRR